MAEESKNTKQRPTRDSVSTQINSSHRLLDMRRVMDFACLSERMIAKLIEAGEFPRGFPVSADSKRPTLRWRLADLERWSQRNAEKAQEAIV